MDSFNQNMTSEDHGSKTAVAVLTLIPGIGLLVSLFVFICVEKDFIKQLRKKVSVLISKCFSVIIKLLQYTWKSVFELHVEVENIISINVQPKNVAFI